MRSHKCPKCGHRFFAEIPKEYKSMRVLAEEHGIDLSKADGEDWDMLTRKPYLQEDISDPRLTRIDPSSIKFISQDAIEECRTGKVQGFAKVIEEVSLPSDSHDTSATESNCKQSK